MVRRQSLETQQRAEWEKWSTYWKLLCECARPSREDIHHFAAFLNSTRKDGHIQRIVVLGSTPELRELAAVYSLEHEARVICIELVETMYIAMSDLMFSKNQREQLKIANWMEMPIEDESIDVVFGDLTEGQISGELKDVYLSEIRRVLKKGGRYITRVTAYPNKSKSDRLSTAEDVRLLVQSYEDQIRSGTLTMQQAANYLGALLLWDSWYMHNDNTLTYALYDRQCDAIRQTLADDPLAQQIITATDAVWGMMRGKVWHYESFEETMRRYKEKFFDITWAYSQDYPVAKYTPIFAMKK